MRKTLITVLVLAAVAAGIFFLVKTPAGSASAGKGEDDDVNPNAVVPVKVGNLSVATVHSYVEAYGTVGGAPATKGEPGASARITVAQPGIVRRVYATEGESVKAGDRLFDLDDRAAVAGLEKAKRTAAAAEAARQRQRTLMASQNSSPKAVQDAEAAAAGAEADLAMAETQVGWAHVTAPIAGTVTRLVARPGEALDTASPAAEITDLHRLVVSVDIPTDDVSHVAVGDDAEVPGDAPVKAKVIYIAAAVDPATNTVSVRAALPDDAALRPGQYVSLRIVAAVHRNVLVAPVESVVTTQEEGKTVIYCVTGNQAVQKEVQTGIREGSVVEVDGEGLKAGDRVVTVGAYGLPEKVKIRVDK